MIKQKIIIFGGTGFIGNHLIQKLAELTEFSEIIVPTRKKKLVKSDLNGKVKFVQLDILKIEDIEGLPLDGALVINLAYFGSEDEKTNIKFVKDLVLACEGRPIRLIHCSTAVVSGRTDESFLKESSRLNPFTEYEKNKIELEQIILSKASDKMEVVVLRPTAVFGEGGRNLVKLIEDLKNANNFKNIIRSLLYGHRSMNLVSVESVVNAFLILATEKENIGKEIFHVSEDNEPENTFKKVEEIVKSSLGISKLSSSLSLPPFILSIVLWISGRSFLGYKRVYSTEKIEKLGWKAEESFKLKIEEYVKWYSNKKSNEL